ncbi:MAG: AAA-like domain-containing protein [Bacteroidaceae bacterium]|nr:AAA-like domain-containing protein [Bacteroidaceae bacterium]
MKRFNTAGTCRPNEHYMVDITERVEIIRKMVAQGDYFCINRGRQYGKTTTLEALPQALASEYTVFKLSFEGASQEAFASLPITFAYFLKSLLFNARLGLTALDEAALQVLEKATEGKDSISDLDFAYTIPMLCRANSKPIVILIDEVDQAGNYDSFLLFLGVLRKMFLSRASLPTFQSVILAGVYDIKNLKLKMRPEDEHQYNSPWNIAAPFNVDMSLSADGIKGMLDDYEADHHKGVDTAEVALWIREYTNGYPFLVSRLCQLMDEQDDWSHEGFLNAVKALLNEHNTLFDDMVKKIEQFPDLKLLLKEQLFSGESRKYNPDNKALQLAERFNIICIHDNTFSLVCRIMETRIYEYFMAEEYESEIYTAGSIEKPQFIKGDGLDMPLLLQKFSEHFNEIFRTEDGTMDTKFVEKQGRKQFQLYIRPIINGTGHYYVEAETRDETRTDLIINYNNHEYVIELKIWRGDSYNNKGENQLFEYLRLKKQKTGYLVSFCFNKGKTPGLLPSVEQDGCTLIEVIV